MSDYEKNEAYNLKAKDFLEYIDKKVIVKFTDGKVIEGEFDSIVPDYDTSTGKDKIELFVESVYIQAPIDEVKTITIV